MAGTKSEENDDEEFGDFTFASFPTFVQPTQTNGGRSAPAGDDVWGDFVESSIGSGFPDTQSSPHVSTAASEPLDPFEFFPNKPTAAAPPLQSTLNRTGSVPNQWVKPKGALPLSIFGEPELPEEQLEVPSSSPDISDGKFRKDSDLNSQNQLGLNLDSNSNGLDANSRSNGTGFVSRSNSSLDFTFQILGMEKDSSTSRFGNHGRTRSLTDMGSSFGLLPQDAHSNPVGGLNLGSDLLNGNKIANGFNSGLNAIDVKADLFSLNTEFDAFKNVYSSSQQSKPENGFGLNSNSSNWDSNHIEFKPSFDALIPNVDTPADDGDFDDGDGWEFKDAYSTFKVENGNDKVDKKEQTNSEVKVFSSVFGNGSNDQSIDLFSASNGFSEKIKEANNNFDFKPTTAALDDFPSDLLFETDPISAENAPNSAHLNGNNEELDIGDDDEWEFKDAYLQKVGDEKDQVNKEELANSEANVFSSLSAAGSINQSNVMFAASNGFAGKAGEGDNDSYFKPPPVAPSDFSSDSLFETEPITAENGHASEDPNGNSKEFDGDDDDVWEFKDACLDKFVVGKDQGNKKVFESPKGALPLSIFGDPELENDTLKVQDGFTYNPSSRKNDIGGQASNVAIHDLISNLYSQAEQITAVDNTEHTAENGSASEKNIDPSIVGYDEDFDGTSWEFKDASLQVDADDQIFRNSPNDTYQSVATKLELNNYVDFYRKLKDKVSFVCRCHLKKMTQDTGLFLGPDTEAAPPQELMESMFKSYEELYEDVVECEELSEDQPLKDDFLSEFLEVLQEEKFRVLESAYDLSRQLQKAVKEFRQAFQLWHQTKRVLNVLTIGSIEDQIMYVSTWSKMISACAFELKHGLRIWEQLTKRNFSFLHETRGKCNIIALAEIYRVLLILDVSIKLYAPWVLLSSVDGSSMYGLIEECVSLWYNSGIQKALLSISEPLDIEYHSTVEALVQSIESFVHLEGFAVRNRVGSQEVSTCRLSLLGSAVVPGMKMVSWSGECYYLTLANLWANLISCDPPELPHLNVEFLPLH